MLVNTKIYRIKTLDFVIRLVCARARKFEELGINAQALRQEIKDLRIAEEGLKMTGKELSEMIQYKEADLKRLILQKQLAS